MGRTLVTRFGVTLGRVRVVPDGIDTEAIAAAPAAAGQADVLFAGRIIPHKHVDDFLDAVLDRGYAVHGLVRRSSGLNRERTDELRAAAKARGLPFDLHYGNLIDPLGLQAVIGRVKPSEIYNLASESRLGISFDEPEHSTGVNAVGVLRLPEIMRLTRPECRLYQASTSWPALEILIQAI